MVSHHILHSQVLNHDGLVFSHQLSRQLIQKILPRIRDCSVDFCCLQSRFIPIVRPLDLAAESFLHPFQLLTKSIKVLWIRNLLSCAQRQQACDAQVNPYRLHCNRQRLNRHIIHQDGNEPPSSSIQFHRNGTGVAAFGQLPAPTDGQGFSAFSQEDLSIFPTKGRLGELSRTPIALLFEVRVLCSTCPEIAKCLLKVSQSLLQGDAAHIIEKLKVFFLFPQGKLSGRLNIVHSLLPFVPSFGSVSQCLVVHQPHTTECSPKQDFLRRGWINSVLEGSSHSHIVANILESLGVSNPTLSAPIPPCAEATGFLGGFR
jgi:hypothetical protein